MMRSGVFQAPADAQLAISPGAGEEARQACEIQTDLPSRYRLLGYLSRGAFASIWRAFDLATGQIVVIKRYPPIGGDRPGDFYKELRALFLLRNPRIVQLFDLMETPSGRRYLVLEFCSGGNLRQAMRQSGSRPWPEPRVRQIALQMAEGLAAAHAVGLVHRDLKPDNILLTKRDSRLFGGKTPIKIADFGLSRSFLSRQAQEGDLPGMSGSPAYMAPEQFVGNYSAASDMYSLGVLMYELLFGKLPFQGDTLTLAQQHLYKSPLIHSDLPPPWPTLLSEMLGKNPETRPTVFHFSQQLNAYAVIRNRPRRSSALALVQRWAVANGKSLVSLLMENCEMKNTTDDQRWSAEEDSVRDALKQLESFLAPIQPVVNRPKLPHSINPILFPGVEADLLSDFLAVDTDEVSSTTTHDNRLPNPDGATDFVSHLSSTPESFPRNSDEAFSDFNWD